MKPATSLCCWRTPIGTTRCTKTSPPTASNMARQTEKRPVRMWIGEPPSCALRLSYGLQDTPPSATGQRSYLPDVDSVEGTSTRTNTSCLCLTTAALPTEAPGSGGFYPSVPLFLSPRQLKPPGAALGQHGTVTYDATRDVPRGEAPDITSTRRGCYGPHRASEGNPGASSISSATLPSMLFRTWL